MKKRVILFMALVLTLSMSACGSSSKTESSATPAEKSSEEETTVEDSDYHITCSYS